MYMCVWVCVCVSCVCVCTYVYRSELGLVDSQLVTESALLDLLLLSEGSYFVSVCVYIYIHTCLDTYIISKNMYMCLHPYKMYKNMHNTY